MAVFKIIQGDSFARNYTSEYYPTLDANWEGTWAIVDKLGEDNTRVGAGDLVISSANDALELRIAPTDTADIPRGLYFLVVEITNVTLAYKREVEQTRCLILPQGIS